MKVAVKYLILVAAFIAVGYAIKGSTDTGITAAGAFIAFAMLEIQDLKTMNQED